MLPGCADGSDELSKGLDGGRAVLMTIESTQSSALSNAEVERLRRGINAHRPALGETARTA
jgi:hypothetical protein